ncbi:MAG: putative Cilia- and flagella-associated protein 52 [Streblomastix strix]|uniref:Putative Cilia-and flagella-associated protein 52 n=1 Tax=Streblomastix strix TaxID=222440 RepID=A0A5J4WDE6_9EUKA|nr:MAG: putative Cilia- and flagella-associated protein 52 [Streblomastix strix]
MSTLELEHCIGGVYTIPKSLHLHPDGRQLASIAGASVVLSDISDPHNQAFLQGHIGSICCLAMSKNGKYIASAQIGDDADIFVWDFAERKLLHKLSQHEHGISCMAFTEEGRLLVTIGDQFDHRLFIWDMKTGNVVSNVQILPNGTASIHQEVIERRPPPQPSRMTASTAAPKGGNVGTNPAEIGFCDVQWGGHARDIKRRETSDLIFATVGPNVSLWTLTPATGELKQEKFVHQQGIRHFTCVGFTSDGEKLIAGTSSGDFVALIIRTLMLESITQACSNQIRSLLVTPSGQVLTGGGDGTLTLFRPQGKQYISQLKKQVGNYKDNAVSTGKDGIKGDGGSGVTARYAVTSITNAGNREDKVLCATADGTVSQIELNDFKQTLIQFSHSGPVSSVSFPFDVNDKFATSSHDDDTIRVWDLSTYDAISTCILPRMHPSCNTWVGECLAVGYTDGVIRFIDALEGQVLWTLVDAHRNGCTAIQGSSDSAQIISGGELGELRVWDVRKRKLQTHMKEHGQAVTNIKLFADNKHAVSGSKDRSMSCVDFSVERRLSTFKTRASINGLTLLPDEKRVVTVHSDRSIVYWDLSMADPIRIVNDAHSEQLTSVASAHDIDLFATGSVDHTVKLWNSDGKNLGEFRGHSGVVNNLVFSPDDKQLITVGDDGNVLVWNVF